MARLDIDRQRKLEPERIKYAIDKLTELGLEPVQQDPTMITFFYKGHKVAFFPYSGWHTGKSIIDGRGIHELLKQLK
jgi:hypothetical protein